VSKRRLIARIQVKGFSLVEVGMAMFILSVVALAGVAYYANARMGEYNEWHEQSALYLSEREVEAWHGGGYIAQTDWNGTEAGSGSYLPFGYSHTDSPTTPLHNGWTVAQRTKFVNSGGVDYFVRAQLLGTPSSGIDYKSSDTWDPNSTGTPFTYSYRRILVHIKWGGSTFANATKLLTVETRIAE
jgi:Tfp pilus assembly protein PilV